MIADSMRPDTLGETRPEGRFMTCVPHRFIGDGLLLFGGFLAGREQVHPGLDLGCPPGLAQGVEYLLGEGQFTVA